METNVEKKGLEHLERIEEDLEVIKQRSSTPKRAFVNGLFQGAGVLIGSAFAFVCIGWLLSFFGVIPGFHDMVEHLREAFDRGRATF